MQDRVVLSVYFSATGAMLVPGELAGLLYTYSKRSDTQLVEGFHGCGATGNWLQRKLGAAFGGEIEDQTAKVEKKVKELLRAGKKVVVNCYGPSRGGVGALKVAKQLGGFASDLVEVNVVTLDPTPGNLIISGELDIFNFTLANQVKDLSDCHNLSRVTSLYPNNSLPCYSFHAPVMPSYPARTVVDEDGVHGTHLDIEHAYNLAVAKAEYFESINEEEKARYWAHRAFYKALTQARFVEALQACGTEFHADFKEQHAPLFTSKEEIKDELDDCTEEFNESTTKDCHSLSDRKIVAIARSTSPADKQVFFNHYHRRLAGKENPLPEPVSKREMDDSEMAQLRFNLFSLGFIIHESMSDAKQNSKKGEILLKFVNDLLNKDKLKTKQDIFNALRNLTALVLQRDQYRFSFFSTTTSGEKLLKLLKSPTNKSLADIIMGTNGNTVRYRDLRSFVIGSNDASYFNARHRDAHYGIFGHLQAGANEPEYDVTKDNFPAFLSRP